MNTERRRVHVLYLRPWKIFAHNVLIVFCPNLENEHSSNHVISMRSQWTFTKAPNVQHSCFLSLPPRPCHSSYWILIQRIDIGTTLHNYSMFLINFSLQILRLFVLQRKHSPNSLEMLRKIFHLNRTIDRFAYTRIMADSSIWKYLRIESGR